MEQGMFAPNGKKDKPDVGTETADVIVLRQSEPGEPTEHSSSGHVMTEAEVFERDRIRNLKHKEEYVRFLARYAASLDGGPQLSPEDSRRVDAGTRQQLQGHRASRGQNARFILDDPGSPWERVKRGQVDNAG
jgi:hypothetical protein